MARKFVSPLEPTRYEVVLYGRNCKRIRTLGFTARKTKASLFDFARSNGDDLLAMMTEEEKEAEWVYSLDTGVVFGLGVCAVAYSGLTERDCVGQR